MIGNKGAVMIKFNLVDNTLIFMNGHLHSGLNGVGKRNHDIAQILRKFVYKSSSTSQILPETTLPDILVLMGDLNYRINGFKPSIMQAMG